MTDYWFFLSYARRNDVKSTLGSNGGGEKSWVVRFYEDLASEIISRGRTGAARAITEVGFLDQSGIVPGEKWSDEVAEALRTSRVMLCLFTLNYFDSEVCGQEFEVFRRRVSDYASSRRSPVTPPLIIPILWHRADRLPKPLPAATADLQYTYEKLPPEYAERGLEGLLRQRKMHDPYQQFLVDIADRIVDVAGEYPMQAAAVCPALKTVRNAFAPDADAPSVATADSSGGPKFIRFVFVVGNRTELESVRRKVDAYADDTRLWRPYVPHAERPVGLLTQDAASAVQLQQEVVPVTEKLIEELEAADEKNIIVVLIVDPWSLGLKLHAQQMKLYDKRNLVSTGVLVVWNEMDQEPGLSPAELQSRVRATFPNSFITNSLYFREKVSSEEALRTELAAAIAEIRRRLAERGKLFRPVDEGGYSAVPQISTPSGAAS